MTLLHSNPKMGNTKIPNNVKTWPAMDRDEEQTVWPTVPMELLGWLDVGNGTVGQPSVIFFLSQHLWARLCNRQAAFSKRGQWEGDDLFSSG